MFKVLIIKNLKMKKFLITTIMSALISSSIFAQTVIHNREEAEALLRKGKTQEVAGIIVSSIGFVTTIVAVNTLLKPERGVMEYARALGISALGVATSVVGIVYLSSGIKKIKKANLFLSSENVRVTPGFKSNERLVSVGLRLNL